MQNQNLLPRNRQLFDFDWRFTKGDLSQGESKGLNDKNWQKINLPHDWSIEGPFNINNPGNRATGFLPGGVGWYRKHFTLPEASAEQKTFIEFDGVFHNSEVWINGHYLGKQPYGYTSFEYDLTPYLNLDDNNVLAVRVDTSDQPNTRWYSGSGIYRHVWLTITDKLHVSHWGTYVTTPKISDAEAMVKIQTKVTNEYQGSTNCQLKTIITDSKGNKIGEIEDSKNITSEQEYEFTQEIKVSNPKLWSVEAPNMYQVISEVYRDQELVDRYITPFGIRKIEFDKDRGFLLNDKPMKLKGVNIHHDAGCVGVAVPERMLERRLEVLKEMGCNAIRCSHNPPAPELLDLCDRMGFLVVDEAFDKWDDWGYYQYLFKDWWKKDLGAMLFRDRNHPSIIMWSVGNEIVNQCSPEMLENLNQLVDYVRKIDPTRPVTCALMPSDRTIPKDLSEEEKLARMIENFVEIAKITDVMSCNYQEQWYELFREAYPEVIILGSESYGFFRGKGSDYVAYEPNNPWFAVEDHDYVIGQFLWAGIDYLGEAEQWPSKGWAASPIDICGFRKSRSYFHESVWSEEPMVHIAVFDDSMKTNPEKPHWEWPKMASHWNFPYFEQGLARLVTFTNCEQVELFLNDDSLGVKTLSDFPDKMMTWYVPYQTGIIKAVGMNNGKVVSEHQLKTAGQPKSIKLILDRTSITADGQDVVHVEVQVVDENGTIVPTADHEITFDIQGEGKIIGVANGDLTSNEPYQGNTRSVYRGRGLIVIQATQKPGTISLIATNEQLILGQVQLETK